MWQATPHVVPFLIELLLNDVPQRERVLTYLGRLAAETSNGGEGAVPPGSDADEAERELWERHGRAGRDTRAAVLRGLDVYRRDVVHEAASVRLAACFLLGQLQSAAATVAPWIEPKLEDTETRVAASATFALGALSSALPSLRGELEARIRDPRPLVRLAAASALARIGPTAQASVIATIGEFLRDSAPVATDYSGLPWSWLNVDTDLARLAGTLDVAAGATLIQPLLDLLDRRKDPIASGTIVTAILRFLFGPVDWEGFRAQRVRRRPAEGLTPEQRRVLEALLHKDIWEMRFGGRASRNGNLGAALNPQQLPTSRDELAAFLGVAF
ncbi:MAG TPA: hypothetical protein VFF73_19460 [Planctomycetota bacterium]|nr:hypothetical protein [Planctomycetota bacterium]